MRPDVAPAPVVTAPSTLSVRAMPLHFSEAEFERRRRALDTALIEVDLDGLLLFNQESHYWLTGFDSFGFCFFQCLVVRRGEAPVLLTRAPDLRQARQTSNINDIRLWQDRDGSDPAAALAALLDELGPRTGRWGVEWQSHGLTAANGERLRQALRGRALEDASDLVNRLRAVKSAEELACIRRAAELADAALDAGLARVRPGMDEGRILAAMQGAVFEGGGDYPGNPFIIGSGPQALLCRYASGRRRLADRDQLTLEFAGVYRQYHAAMMRTVLLGPVDPAHERMHAACVQALRACEAALHPGRTVGEAFDAHAVALDAAGYRAHRLNACGYGQGARYAPSWMDWPMLYHANPVIVEPDMVFFLHMILMDSDSGRAMTLGHTVHVTAAGCVALSRHTPALLAV